MARSAHELASKFERVAKTLPEANREAIGVASLNIKTGWLAIAAAHGMPPGKKLHGVGRGRKGNVAKGVANSFTGATTSDGANWGVRYNVKGNLNPTAMIGFYGPVHLVFGPTKAHVIMPRVKGARAKRQRNGMALMQAMTGKSPGGGGRGAVLIGGSRDNPRAFAHHPGTKGKTSIWPECKAYASRVGPNTFQAALPGAIYRAGFGH